MCPWLTRDEDAPPADRESHARGRTIDFVIISVLCAAVLLFAYDKWWPQAPIDRSIVVLPFQNLSDDPENQYFSDGLAEEIINALTKIKGLKVIARTSAFSFKGKEQDIRKIAEAVY